MSRLPYKFSIPLIIALAMSGCGTDATAQPQEGAQALPDNIVETCTVDQRTRLTIFHGPGSFWAEVWPGGDRIQWAHFDYLSILDENGEEQYRHSLIEEDTPSFTINGVMYSVEREIIYDEGTVELRVKTVLPDCN